MYKFYIVMYRGDKKFKCPCYEDQPITSLRNLISEMFMQMHLTCIELYDAREDKVISRFGRGMDGATPGTGLDVGNEGLTENTSQQ